MKALQWRSSGLRGLRAATATLAASLLASGCGGHAPAEQPALTTFSVAVPANLALNKAAVGWPGGSAAVAVDGSNANGVSQFGVTAPFFSSGASANAYWEVDLGSAQAVANVEIWGHSDGSTSTANNYWVFLSTNRLTASTAAAAQSDPSLVFATHIVGAQTMPVQTIDVNATGEFLRLMVDGSVATSLNLAEVRAYGPANGTTTQPIAPTLACTVTEPSTDSSKPTQCVGPWSFRTVAEPCSVAATGNNNSSCPLVDNPSSPIPNTCNWCTNSTNSQTMGGYVAYRSLPNVCKSYNAKGICMGKGTMYTASQSCVDLANSRVPQLQAQYPGCYDWTWVDPGVPVKGPTAGTESFNLSDMYCTWNMLNVGQFQTSANSDHCGYSGKYNQWNSNCQIESYGACGDNAAVSYSASGLASGDLATLYPPNHLVSAVAVPNNAAQGDIFDANVAAVCTTCDDIKMQDRSVDTTGATVIAKAQCLTNTSFPGMDSATAAKVYAANAVNAKLLYESRADQLGTAQGTGANAGVPLTTLIERYYADSEANSPTPQCGSGHWSAPAASAAACSAALGAAQYKQLNLDMQVCERLSGSSSNNYVRPLFEARCLQTLSGEIRNLPAACDKVAYNKTYEPFALAWMQAQLGAASNLDFSSSAPVDKNVAAIESQLGFIEGWYSDQLAIQGTTETAPGSDVTSDLSSIVISFWQGILPVGPTAGAVAANPATVLQSTANELEAYREVLLALFDSNASTTLTGPLFAQIFSDALEPVWQRLGDAVLYHDLGCRFADCINTNRSSELTDMWQMIAVFADGDALHGQVGRFDTSKNPTNPSLIQADWQAVFTAMDTNHGRLENAVAAVLGKSYSKTLVVNTPTSQLPASLVGWQKILLDAGTKMTSYKSSGSLGGLLTNTLHTGIEKSQVVNAKNDLTAATQPLDSDIANWNTDEPALISALLAQANNASDQASINDKLLSLVSDYNTADAQIAALRHNNDIDDAHFGDFLTGWNNAVAGSTLSQQFTTTTYQNVLVTPASARASAGSIATASAVSSVAVRVDPKVTTAPVDHNSQGSDGLQTLAIPAKQGDFLQINSSGTWAPTCAFSHYNWPSGFTNLSAIDPSTQVGPDGFMLTHSNSAASASAQNNSSSVSTTETESVNACLTATLTTGTPLGGVIGDSASLTASVATCLGLSGSGQQSQSATSTASDQDSMSASFASGLRIPVNPFPNFPTGALLVVEVPTDSTKPMRVAVVHGPNSGFVVDQAATIYLVVNDVAGCAAPATPGELTLTVAYSTPLSALAYQLGPLMASEINLFRNGGTDSSGKVRLGAADYVAQGAFLAGDRSELQDSALEDLRLAINPLGLLLSSMPAEMMSFYQNRVDYELNRIDRLVQIGQLQLKEQQTQLAMLQLNDQLQSDALKNQLIQMQVNWEAMLMDQSALRADTETAANFMMNYIYPIFRVRYPALLGVSGNGFYQGGANNRVPAPAIAALLNVNWRDELLTQAKKVQAAELLITGFFNEQDTAAPPLGAHPVILSIPRPDILMKCQNPNPDPDALPFLCKLSAYPRISMDRAQQFWQSLDKTGTASFNVSVNDLYASGGSNSLLTCGQTSPVIESMQLIFNTGGDSTNYGTFNNINMHAVGDMIFTTATGPEEFVMADPDWLGSGGGILFSDADQVEATLTQFLGNDHIHEGFGEGLSPFQTFNIDMHNFLKTPTPPDNWPVISSLQEVLVAFEIEYGAGDTSYLAACH